MRRSTITKMDEEEEEEVASMIGGYNEDRGDGSLKNGYKPPSPTNATTGELIELLQRLQSSRLDDQRCSLPGTLSERIAVPIQQSSANNGIISEHDKYSQKLIYCEEMLNRVLKTGKNRGQFIPLISILNKEDFWIEETGSTSRSSSSGIKWGDTTVITSSSSLSSSTSSSIDSGLSRVTADENFSDNVGEIYREHFVGSEHFNFCGYVGVGGDAPVVMSIKFLNFEIEESTCTNNVRVIVRLKSGSLQRILQASGSSIQSSSLLVPSKILQSIIPKLNTSTFQLWPIMCPGASKLIRNYDEHEEVTKFKFGLMYQKVGQVTEEEILNNETHSESLTEFLHMLGKISKLSEHVGYRGGLDTKYGQTGEYLLYDSSFQNCEVVFHVSTLLPYTKNDRQQLQRKCHIGNDIVTIVFQDGETPFSPEMITSHFLHAFIVVRPINPCSSKVQYQVSVTAKHDVPSFGPSLPQNSTFDKGAQFKDFLFAKLINGEKACYKAKKFDMLNQRTRMALLTNLVNDLKTETDNYLLHPKLSSKLGSHFGPQSTSILSTMKKALTTSRKNSEVGLGKGLKSVSFKKLEPYDNLSSVTEDLSTQESNKSTNSSIKSDSLIESSPSSETAVDFIYKENCTQQSRNGVISGVHLNINVQNHNYSRNKRSGTVSTDHSSVISSEDSDSNSFDTSTWGHHSHTNLSSNTTSNSVLHMSGSNDSGIVPNINEQSSNDSFVVSDSQQNSGHSKFLNTRDNEVNSNYHQNVLSGCITSINVETISAQKFRINDGISRLKIEKLDLLRQILSVQHEIRRLKDREFQLRDDLTAASREIEYFKAQSAFLQFTDQHQQDQEEKTNQQHFPSQTIVSNSNYQPKETKSFRTTSFKVMTKDR